MLEYMVNQRIPSLVLKKKKHDKRCTSWVVRKRAEIPKYTSKSINVVCRKIAIYVFCRRCTYPRLVS